MNRVSIGIISFWNRSNYLVQISSKITIKNSSKKEKEIVSRTSHVLCHLQLVFQPYCIYWESRQGHGWSPAAEQNAPKVANCLLLYAKTMTTTILTIFILQNSYKGQQPTRQYGCDQRSERNYRIMVRDKK